MAEISAPCLLNATSAAKAVREGALTSEELVESCLERIAEREDEIGAWAHLDPDHAREQARTLDKHRAGRRSIGPLHGVPVGIKDIIDTQDYPTEHGTAIYSGRTPGEDATVVSLLREAGAVIMGKTVTTEMAVMSPGKTRNPHNPKHTPGGSSSGSAAAVSAGMVPLAVGSQTNGSIIRPASYCGIFGLKPTYGLISRHRVLLQSPPLDTIGLFARSLEDIALISEVVMRFDGRDPAMRPTATPHMSRILSEEPPMDPRLVFIRTPAWGQVEETTKDAFREMIEHLGGRGVHVDLMDLPDVFDDALDAHRTIMEADLAKSFAREYEKSKDRLSDVLCEMIERGKQVLATDYNAAVERIGKLDGEIAEIGCEYDAILAPSTAGEAPAGLETTGSPVLCTIWTLAGVPALNLPMFQGPKGLPLGAQLVSARHDDARLPRTARWLLGRLEE